MYYNIHWFRRDLRTNDNVSLHHALKSDFPVKCVFIFDEHILEELPANDKRVAFIHQQLTSIHEELKTAGGSLTVFHGKPQIIFEKLALDSNLKAVFTNHDYEPYAINRDNQIGKILEKNGKQFKTFKDHVIFEKEEILTASNSPYKVYTPYSKAWKEKLNEENHLKEFSVKFTKQSIFQEKANSLPSLKTIGFENVDITKLPLDLGGINIDNYGKVRDFPAKKGTTKLGAALRFGTLSIRKAVKFAIKHNQTFLNELIWREFFAQILFNFPKVVTEPFHEKYAAIEWRNNKEEFELWKQGKTGFPIVDAGMRELNETGFMHNRVRMIVASFLVKDLLIDWRWGEAYFAEKLMDYELASNNGNWQWAAGCGTDAAPYFRIFNPETQFKKFDPEEKYVETWLPEYGSDDYPEKIVDHKEARERCLAAFQKVV